MAQTLANETSLAKALARDEQLAFALAQEGSGLSLALALVRRRGCSKLSVGS